VGQVKMTFPLEQDQLRGQVFHGVRTDCKLLANNRLPLGSPLGSAGESIVVAIPIPHAGEGGAKPFVEPEKRSRMRGMGSVFGMRKSRAGACHAGSYSFSGYAAAFLIGRPIAVLISTA